MPIWSAGMQQTFEYYTVDPGTWRDSKLLTNVRSCSIERNLDNETLGSASFDIIGTIGEEYIRVYLVTIQNGVRERFSLGTFLVQTPSTSFDGKVRTVTVDAYTPLLELKESMPPLGYSALTGDNIMERAYRLVREHVRAPVVKTESSTDLSTDFVANTSDTWLTFVRDLIAHDKYRFDLDEQSRILFAPDQDAASLQPIWTFDDGNSSILHPDITLDHDMYGIPNVVEAVYSTSDTNISARAVNDDPNSPISTVNRGREIVFRDTSPALAGEPTLPHLEQYAQQMLRNLSSIEYSVTYTHGYCPVRLGDCVFLDYRRSGIPATKAKVVSQSISCEPGCPVTEKAVFTTKLWG